MQHRMKCYRHKSNYIKDKEETMQKCNIYKLLDKTKVMASGGIACRILIQNELLEQMDTFPYLGSLITEDGECTTEFRTRLNRGQAIEASLHNDTIRYEMLF